MKRKGCLIFRGFMWQSLRPGCLLCCSSWLVSLAGCRYSALDSAGGHHGSATTAFPSKESHLQIGSSWGGGTSPAMPMSTAMVPACLSPSPTAEASSGDTMLVGDNTTNRAENVEARVHAHAGASPCGVGAQELLPPMVLETGPAA